MSEGAILSKLVKGMKNADEDPLRPLLDEYYTKRNRAKNRVREVTIPLVDRPRPGGRLSPSAIFGCKRQSAMRFAGVRGYSRQDPDRESIFDQGTWIHHRHQANFKDMEAVLGRDRFRVISIEERVMIPELFVCGSLDVLVAIKVNGRWVRYLIDIKSINDRGFQRVIADQKPLEAHVRQITTYCKARRVKRGFLFYENKNDQLTKGFVIDFQHEIWAEVEEWCEEVILALQEKTLPPMSPDCQSGNMLYDKCQYARVCYGNKSNEQIRQMTYKNFDGIEVEWKKGLEVEDEFDEAMDQ